MRNRSWRRDQTKRVQKKRLRDLLATWWKTISQPNHLGRLKKNHFGCGCFLCKPQKHGKFDTRKKETKFGEEEDEK